MATQPQQKVPVYEVNSFMGGISDFEDRGGQGAFKFASGIDIRKKKDTLTCQQALMDIGVTEQSPSASISPSASGSPSASVSPSPSASPSPSSSVSPSPSDGVSGSASPSSSRSPSASQSPSNSMSASPSPSDGLKTIFRDLIIKFVKASDGFIYGTGNTGKIYKISPTDFTTLQVYDAHQAITGAEEKPSFNGKTYLLWASRTDLHRKELPGRSDWNDVDVTGAVQGDEWPKTNLQDADWHMTAQVGGDVLIGNNSFLAMAAYDDSYTNEALDLIPGNIVKAIIERQGRAVVGTYRAADPNKGINAMIDTEVPLVQAGEDGELFYGDFVNKLPVKRFPGGGKVNPGGVCNLMDPVQLFDWEQDALSWLDKQTIGNLALFGVYGADAGMNGIYSYGRLDMSHDIVMNLDYPLEVDQIGAICSQDGIIYASYQLGSEFGVKVLDVNNKQTGIYEGLDFKAPVKKPEDATTWKLVEIFCEPLPANTSIEFWYKLDKTGNFIKANTADKQINFSKAGGKKAVFVMGSDGDIYEPRLVLNPSGNNTPEVSRHRTYFL